MLAMASTWAVSTFPEDVTFTYNWTIDDLVKGLERDVDGAIESPSFKMPGLPWDFFLRITRTVFKYKTDPDGEISEFRYPKELQIEEATIPITSFFGVQLYVEDPDETMEDLKELKLAGSLSLSETDDQGVERLKLTGQIYRWYGPPELGGEKSHGKLGLLWIMKIIKSDADLNFVVSLSFGTKTSRQAWSKKI